MPDPYEENHFELLGRESRENKHLFPALDPSLWEIISPGLTIRTRRNPAPSVREDAHHNTPSSSTTIDEKLV